MAFGNIVTRSLNITTIDKENPIIGSATGSTTTGNTGSITISGIEDKADAEGKYGVSGLSGIYISKTNTAPTETSTWTNNTASSYTYTATSNGTYYIWVKDIAGNISEVKTATVSGIVGKS